MRILGIDPGYDRVGIAIIDKLPRQKEVLVYSECFETSAKDEFPSRLFQVGERIREILEKFSPNILSIESLFITKNQKTAMRVSEARGVIIYEAIKQGLEICEYTPLQVKTAVTGHGKSDKNGIIKMIRVLLKLPDKKMLDDEYDAIAVALTCMAYSQKSFPQK